MIAKNGFAAFHRWDRNFFLLMVVSIWLGILMGFVPEVVHHVQMHKPPYPAIVHFHAVAFVGWLVLLTTQLLLVRFGRTDIHRKLGVVGAFLAATMVALGVATARITDYLHFGTPLSNPSFLSIQLGDMIAFGPLVAAAVLLRNTPAAHKRLILLATIFICDPGFARWWGGTLSHLLGHGFWPDYVSLYVSDFLLVVALGAYDLITRRRLHPAYIVGASWGFAVQLIAIWLYVSPWWKPVATALIGR